MTHRWKRYCFIKNQKQLSHLLRPDIGVRIKQKHIICPKTKIQMKHHHLQKDKPIKQIALVETEGGKKEHSLNQFDMNFPRR